MPRRGRGGGAQGNRTDLNTAVPAAAPADPRQPGGRDFGQSAADAEAMQAQPMRPPPSEGVEPGGLGGFARDSERGDEPITAGIDRGPGPGSDVLNGGRGLNPRPRSALDSLAEQVDNPFIQALARYAPGS